MKIRLVFKTPDVLYDTLQHELGDAPQEEWTKAAKACEKFVKWGEEATIEIDTETKTAEVIIV